MPSRKKAQPAGHLPTPPPTQPQEDTTASATSSPLLEPRPRPLGKTITRERVRQIEREALWKLKRALIQRGITGLDDLL